MIWTMSLFPVCVKTYDCSYHLTGQTHGKERLRYQYDNCDTVVCGNWDEQKRMAKYHTKKTEKRCAETSVK